MAAYTCVPLFVRVQVGVYLNVSFKTPPPPCFFFSLFFFFSLCVFVCLFLFLSSVVVVVVCLFVVVGDGEFVRGRRCVFAYVCCFDALH